MARKRHSDEDILKLLREIELKLSAVEDVASACRYGISYANFCIYRCLSRCKVSSVLMWWRFHGCKHLSGVASRMARPNGNPVW
jgi:hypothetical protein